MNVLLCGANGFIGRHVAAAMQAAGHRVIQGVRQPDPDRRVAGAQIQIDFGASDLRVHGVAQRRMLQTLQAVQQQHGRIDAVVNAVGILRGSPERPIDLIHHLGPQALFDACAALRIRRVIQISALGIDDPAVADLPYARSKWLADRALLELTRQGRLDGIVLRPSVVYGPGGASAKLFDALASLPVLCLPQPVQAGRVQPVAVQDLAAAVVALIAQVAPDPVSDPLAELMTEPGTEPIATGVLPVVGPVPMRLVDFIAHLRTQRGGPRAPVWVLPRWVTAASIWCGDRVAASPWGSETAVLLEGCNQADPAPLQALLGAACALARRGRHAPSDRLAALMGQHRSRVAAQRGTEPADTAHSGRCIAAASGLDLAGVDQHGDRCRRLVGYRAGSGFVALARSTRLAIVLVASAGADAGRHRAFAQSLVASVRAFFEEPASVAQPARVDGV